jgi:predicted NAD-dependent protein-ADP-ribosyltransferase YbiA (DUF1768 family)
VTQPILFYRVDDPYGFLPNFAPYPFTLDGRVLADERAGERVRATLLRAQHA